MALGSAFAAQDEWAEHFAYSYQLWILHQQLPEERAMADVFEALSRNPKAEISSECHLLWRRDQCL